MNRLSVLRPLAMGLGALVWMGCSSPSGGASSPYGTASPDSSADGGATGIGDGEGGATAVGALSSREVGSLTFTRVPIADRGGAPGGLSGGREGP